MPSEEIIDLSAIVEPVGYNLGPGEGGSSLRGVHHPVPVGLSDDESHLAHLALFATLLDVSPADLERRINMIESA